MAISDRTAFRGVSGALPGPVFSVAEARAAGVPLQALRRREYDDAGHGLRAVRGRDLTLPDRVRPFASEAGHTLASHTTAAALWGIWLPLRLESGPLHMTRPHRYAQLRRKGIVGHNAVLQRADVVRCGGLLVTSPAFTWTDLAGLLSPDELVAAGDSLLRRPDAPQRGGFPHRPDPLCSIEALRQITDRRAGVRGMVAARTALGLVRPGVDSAPESRLRLLIRHSGLPEPEVNQWIISPAGKPVSRPDLHYRLLRIALEYEGEHHLVDPDQWHRDIERDERLRAMGWTVLRFSKKHLRPENQVAAAGKIRSALMARGWHPGQAA